MVPADHLGRNDLVRRVVTLASMVQFAIVLEAVGVALVILALARDDQERRRWFAPHRFP